MATPAGETLVEPDLQKLAATALGGLVLFFPVFNAVGDTALEALYDADHKSKFKDFFKDWGDIPEDEKLRYWDGKTKPPAGQGGDDDLLDDDSQVRPPGEPGSQDTDGDGVPDAEDPDPKDPNVTQEREFHLERVELFSFEGDGFGDEPIPLNIELGHSYETVEATIEVDNFNGQAIFELAVAGARAWSWELGQGVPTVGESLPRSTTTAATDVGTADIVIEYDYDPLTEPDAFIVIISGTYKVYEDDA